MISTKKEKAALAMHEIIALDGVAKPRIEYNPNIYRGGLDFSPESVAETEASLSLASICAKHTDKCVRIACEFYAGELSMQELRRKQREAAQELSNNIQHALFNLKT